MLQLWENTLLIPLSMDIARVKMTYPGKWTYYYITVYIYHVLKAYFFLGYADFLVDFSYYVIT